MLAVQEIQRQFIMLVCLSAQFIIFPLMSTIRLERKRKGPSILLLIYLFPSRIHVWTLMRDVGRIEGDGKSWRIFLNYILLKVEIFPRPTTSDRPSSIPHSTTSRAVSASWEKRKKKFPSANKIVQLKPRHIVDAPRTEIEIRSARACSHFVRSVRLRT